MKKNSETLQNRDTAMAITFLFLLVFFFSTQRIFLLLAMLNLIIGMTIPMIFRPLSTLWFGLGKLLGIVSSHLILFLSYIIFVTPVSLLKRKYWKKKFRQYDLKINPLHYSPESKNYKKEDIIKPF